MKIRLVSAVALSLALSSLAAPAAMARDTAGQAAFRSAAPQSFTASDLQSYGLDASAAQRAVDLQAQGYQIKVLSREEAAQYQAGITDNQWIWLGILAGVIIIAVAVAD